MDHINISEKIKSAMVEHAVRELPNECCGVLLGQNNTIERVIPVRNANPSPDSYLMDPEQQIEIFSEMERLGESLIGIYHSHPEGPYYPSVTDIQFAFHHEAVYFIVSLKERDHPGIHAFFIEEGSFREIALECD